jgi:hypothetical protein
VSPSAAATSGRWTPYGSSAGEELVGLRPRVVALAEHHIEDDGFRVLRGDAGCELAVHCARPGPAVGELRHPDQAGVVDVHEHHLGIRLVVACLHPDEQVRQVALEGKQQADALLDESEQDEGRKDQREGLKAGCGHGPASSNARACGGYAIPRWRRRACP